MGYLLAVRTDLYENKKSKPQEDNQGIKKTYADDKGELK